MEMDRLHLCVLRDQTCSSGVPVNEELRWFAFSFLRILLREMQAEGHAILTQGFLRPIRTAYARFYRCGPVR